MMTHQVFFVTFVANPCVFPRQSLLSIGNNLKETRKFWRAQ